MLSRIDFAWTGYRRVLVRPQKMSRVGLFDVWVSGLAESQRTLFPFSPGEVDRNAWPETTVTTIGVQCPEQHADLGQIDRNDLLQVGNLASSPILIVL